MINRPRVALVGDVGLRTPHFGCQLVGQAFREQFARVGLNLIYTLPSRLEIIADWKRRLSEVDLVVINGEGSIHHGRFQSLINLASEYPCALVNCVYQANPENKNLNKFKWISCRESMSAKEIRNQGIDCKVVPDVLFVSSFLRSFVPLETRMRKIGYTDCAEKEVKKIGPLKISYRIGFSPKTKKVSDYLNFLALHERMAVGRFHAAVCCSVMGIPFAAWDSNTWKIEGLMHDMKVPSLHFKSRREALSNVPADFPHEVLDFRASAINRIESMFNCLADIARD